MELLLFESTKQTFQTEVQNKQVFSNFYQKKFLVSRPTLRKNPYACLKNQILLMKMISYN